MEIQRTWKNFRQGKPVQLVKDVYHRMDGTTWGGVYYEPPGKVIAKRGMIGTFTGKTENGLLVYFNTGVGGILGLVVDEHALTAYNPRTKT